MKDICVKDSLRIVEYGYLNMTSVDEITEQRNEKLQQEISAPYMMIRNLEGSHLKSRMAILSFVTVEMQTGKMYV